ncbi:MAG: GNAT family N-acetyltransferase [Candidatus Binatia bacterium]|nr:GNAT family N-acetyltransferase [Candidatus Binatia bacterium]MDW8252344.1 GNAT family N-acetyltransferase [Chloroflexota bacterium]
MIGILRAQQHAFGFIRTVAVAKEIERGEVLLGEREGIPVGTAIFHHRRDGITTLHAVAVRPDVAGTGVGRALLDRVETLAREQGQRCVRLKCPIDLPGNGFYARLGYARLTIEMAPKRPLAIWLKELPPPGQRRRGPPTFYLSLTHSASEIRQIMRLWDAAGDPRDPFRHVVFTPLFAEKATFRLIQQLKQDRGSTVMFDSGGYQVQMGRIGFPDLLTRLLELYRTHTWADWYVLPDHVPKSTDSDDEVAAKVNDTLHAARFFLRHLPDRFAERALAVVHGRTIDQIEQCLDTFSALGIRYVGFGSFTTAGRRGSVNQVNKLSLSLLSKVYQKASQLDLSLHIFGVGSPYHIRCFQSQDIIPNSFDSSGWWKSAGFGNIFSTDGNQMQITEMPSARHTITEAKKAMNRTNHECNFCKNLSILRKIRIYRVMHNLSIMNELVHSWRST